MPSNQKTLLITLAILLGCFLIAIVPLAVLGVFAVRVYGTHQEWNEEIAESTSHSMIEEYADRRSQDATRIAELEDQLAMERAARRQAVAALEARARHLTERLAQLEERNRALNESQRAAIEAVDKAEENLLGTKEGIPSLRDHMADAEPDRDERLEHARDLADQVHETRSVQRQLEERRQQLAKALAKRREIMEKHGLSEDPPADVSPPAERAPPAKFSGVIQAVSKSGLIEVSVGSDDGLREGQELDVLDQDEFVTRAVVLKTTPNQAVGRIIQHGPAVKIEKGYRVVPRSEE